MTNAPLPSFLASLVGPASGWVVEISTEGQGVFSTTTGFATYADAARYALGETNLIMDTDSVRIYRAS